MRSTFIPKRRSSPTPSSPLLSAILERPDTLDTTFISSPRVQDLRRSISKCDGFTPIRRWLVGLRVINRCVCLYFSLVCSRLNCCLPSDSLSHNACISPYTLEGQHVLSLSQDTYSLHDSDTVVTEKTRADLSFKVPISPAALAVLLACQVCDHKCFSLSFLALITSAVSLSRTLNKPAPATASIDVAIYKRAAGQVSLFSYNNI